MIAQDHTTQMTAWRKLRDIAEHEPQLDQLDQIELALLRTPPRTAPEAANIVEIVRLNLMAGGRSDGMDAEALHHVGRFLKTLSPAMASS